MGAHDYLFENLESVEEARQANYSAVVARHIRNKWRKAGHPAEGETLDELLRFLEFPFTLIARKLPYIHKITLADLFHRFTKLPFIDEMEQVRELHNISDQTGVAFVFPWAAVALMMACHNMEHIAADTSGTVLVRPLPRQGRVLYLQPLDALLDVVLQKYYGKADEAD